MTTSEEPMHHLPGLLSDEQIRHLCEDHEQPMIAPYVNSLHRFTNGGKTKIVSFGPSSYGYDIRAAPEWKVFTNLDSTIVDPKRLDPTAFVEKNDESIVIPPNSFALARSVECFQMPTDVLGVVLGKSTYARCGIVVNCTPMEPGWRGYLTIEISNTTPLPAKVYANEGIAQVLFFRGSQPCRTSYADRQGKYQDQPAKVILPRM